MEIESFLGGGNTLDIDTSAVNDGLSIADGQLPSVKVSDNIAAFVNYANRFKVFYKGELNELETYTVTSFDVGRNVVPYVDANRNFKVFYKERLPSWNLLHRRAIRLAITWLPM
ncbi:hypothetical protein FQZ97_738910 [compost metagenome]